MKRVRQLWLHNAFARLTGESRTLRLVAEKPNKGLGDLARLLETGQLVPVIDRTFPLGEVPQALSYFGEGRHRGKIAISIAP